MTIRYVQLGMSTGSSGFLGHFSTCKPCDSLFEHLRNAILSVCTGNVLNYPNGRLSSPGFGLLTPTDRDCQWTIRVTPGNLIVAQVVYFKIGNSLGRTAPSNATAASCTNGYFEVGQPVYPPALCLAQFLALQLDSREILAVTLNSQENVTDRTRFCDGVAVPSWIYSKGSQLTVKFASTRQNPENHFALEWSLSANSKHSILVSRSLGLTDVSDFRLRRQVY